MVRMQTSGRATHSAFHPRPSRSWMPVNPSSRTESCERASRHNVSRCSAVSGLRLCGMVMLPIPAAVAASRTSSISGRCSSSTSLPIRASVAPTSTSAWANSTTRSRLVVHEICGSPELEQLTEALP